VRIIDLGVCIQFKNRSLKISWDCPFKIRAVEYPYPWDASSKWRIARSQLSDSGNRPVAIVTIAWMSPTDGHVWCHKPWNTVHRLPTKEGKRPFSVSICSKQRKFTGSAFRLQKTNGSCRFPLVPFPVYGIPETWTWRNGDTDKWRHEDMKMETLEHRDM
jgi:hypothetical protein